MRKGTWFQTYIGIQFWPVDPDPSDINIEDIAQALSLQCRFNGHVRAFYSIAQHSVYVSRLVSQEFAFEGLMHDAAEAYTGDMVRPLKLCLPDFRAAEDVLERAVAERFKLRSSSKIDEEIRQSDDVMLVTEMRDFMSNPPVSWGVREEPIEEKLVSWSPELSKKVFLDRFNQLSKES